MLNSPLRSGDFRMTASTSADFAPSPQKPFAPYHPWDRNFFLALVVAIWLALLSGFTWDVIDHFVGHHRAYPLLTHLHALTMVGWVSILTAQVLLIRSGHAATHRRLGLAAMALAAVMPFIGLATAWLSQRLDFGTPDGDPPFASIQIGGFIVFTVLVWSGFLLRRDASAHKRLMLLSTIDLAGAGFGRLWGFAVGDALGHGFWSFTASADLGKDLLIAALGLYDLVTRGRLHPAYLVATVGMLASQWLQSWLYFDPTWKIISLKLIGH